MKQMYKPLLFLLLGLVFFQCSESKQTILIKNSSNIDCSNETVVIAINKLEIQNIESIELLGVVDIESNEEQLSQKIDSDRDGKSDLIIFQPKVKANSQREYKIIPVVADTIESKVFSRFVPERTDDYAWENDKVAFRTFGPVAQKMNEDGIPGGTLSSGVDCWLKSVDYPIINKRYKGYLTNPNYYHIDHGNGFDPYHVGRSRGCGGIGVWKDSILFVSKNFTAYNTVANGPIRTCFTLDYANWNAEDKVIKEQKHINLDLGNNLMHTIDIIEGVDEVTVGLTLHENAGETTIDTVNYCFSYWESMRDSELGTGIVIEPKYYNGYSKIISDEPDKSQLLVHLKVIDGKVAYYSGFGWKKSGQFADIKEWDAYLVKLANSINNPLEVEY